MDEAPSLPFAQRLTRRQRVTIDAVFAVVIATASILASALGHRTGLRGTGWDATRYVAIVLACIPLPLRQRSPLPTLCLIAPADLLLIAMGDHGPPLIGAAIVVYSVAAMAPRRTSLVAALVLVAGIVITALAGSGGPAWASVLSQPAVVMVGWLAGENTRGRRAYAQGIADRATERERERTERALRAVSDERLRIARDLHDIVAHAMSLIAIRSGVARMVLDTQPDEAREALGIIETTSRRALTEMRLMVGVLRQAEDSPELGPAPGLADLSGLIDQVGEAGVDVDVDSDGDAQLLPAGVDLSAYRILQEALTNVVRHAGPTTVRVMVRHRPHLLELEVVDQGARAARVPALTPDGPGHGLVGMRERVGLFGGDLSAAPEGDGFRVFATLPFDEATR